MAHANIQDDITLQAVAVFRTGERRNDPVSAAALFKFLEWSEANEIEPAKAKQFLGNAEAVSDYIEKVRAILTASVPEFGGSLSSTRDQLLSAIHSDTQQTLSVQQEMQNLLRRQSEVASRLEAASARNEVFSKRLDGSVSKVLSNTSTRTAFILGMLAGTIANLGTSYVFDRYWSVDAVNRRHHQDDVPALVLPELVPPPPPDGTDLMRLFQQNNVYVFLPTPSPAVVATPRDPQAKPPAHVPLRHQR